MRSVIAILCGLAAVLGSAPAAHIQPKLLCTNSTLNISHPVNATACSSNVTGPTSTDLLPTIYTSPPNSSIPPPIFHLYSFNASIDPYDSRAHYSFKWIVNPDFNAVQCRASVPAPNGTLADVKVAYCQQDESWRKIHNYTVPAHFTFGWANLMSPNTSTTTTSSRPAAPGGWNGTAALLVLRSTNPASAHHCPDFPHDACWAQGLHWVPRADVVTVRRKGGGGSGVEGQEEYVGAEDLVVVGRYCRSGVPECAWSEYLY